MIRQTIQVEKRLDTDVIPYLVQSACHYNCSLHILSGDKNINMKSIMGMTILTLDQGGDFDLLADGEDEEKAIRELADCF